MAHYRPIILSDGFRLFFLSAAIIAMVNMAIWIGYFAGYIELHSLFSPVIWHFHEMIYGFIGAVIAGFLLTAVPNWTNRPALKGKNLLALWALWVFGRVVTFYSEYTGVYFALLADLPFIFILSLYVFWQISQQNSKRNMPVVLVLLFLGGANTLMYVEYIFGFSLSQYGYRLSIVLVATLIMLIGGRIIPNFTRNSLRNMMGNEPQQNLPILMNKFDISCIIISLIGLLLWVVLPDEKLVGMLLMLVGFLHLIRLSRWRFLAIYKIPMLCILHVAYMWLAVGFFLLGLFIYMDSGYYAVAIHVITVGAFTNMILGVMTRASLGHTGRVLTAAKTTILLYIAINIAVIARMLAPFSADFERELLYLSSAGWFGAFGLFIIEYTAYFFTARK